MPENIILNWLPLNEAADLFSQSCIPQLFDDLLKSGRVKLYGKPPFQLSGSPWLADPIEHFLPRVRNVRIDVWSNAITLDLLPDSGWEREIAEQFALVSGALIPSEWSVKFTGVRVDRASLFEEAEANGFNIRAEPKPAKSTDDKIRAIAAPILNQEQIPGRGGTIKWKPFLKMINPKGLRGFGIETVRRALPVQIEEAKRKLMQRRSENGGKD
jgi:hypothetical protein